MYILNACIVTWNWLSNTKYKEHDETQCGVNKPLLAKKIDRLIKAYMIDCTIS